MREPRAEVTGRIDRISRSTTQGETDRCNEETDDERVQPFGEFIRPDEEEAITRMNVPMISLAKLET